MCSESVAGNLGSAALFETYGVQAADHDPEDAVARALPDVKHEVAGLIGAGNFSSTYRCHAEAYGKVAVKVFSIGVSLRPEVADIKGLKHPNVVRIFQICAGERVGIVMELCGGTLRDALHGPARHMPAAQEPVERLRAAADVLAAVEYLHSHSILHRNIGAQNCFVALDAATLSPVKLGDFMLARSVAACEMTTWTGTICYMAPEVVGDSSYGFPADVFSSAVLAHEIACRERPYGGSNHVTLLMQVVRGLRPDCRKIPQLGGGAHDKLVALLPLWWHDEPAERPPAHMAAAAIQDVLRLAAASAGAPPAEAEQGPPAGLPAKPPVGLSPAGRDAALEAPAQAERKPLRRISRALYAALSGGTGG